MAKATVRLVRDQRLKRFQDLERCLETDGSRCNAISAGRLSHDRVDQVVRQDVGPDLLADKLRRLATQDVHLKDVLDRPPIEFNVPASTIELSEVVLGKHIRVQQRRGDHQATDPKAPLLDPHAAFPDQEGIGQRIVGLSIDRAWLRWFLPFDEMIILAEPRPPAKVGLAVGRQPANAVNATLLEHHHLRPGTHQAVTDQDVAGAEQARIWRNNPDSLCPLPAYRQIPRSRIDPHDSEMMAATRATTKLVPGFWL